MPFQVHWEGVLRVERSGHYRIQLETNSRGRIDLNDRVLMELAETPADKHVVTRTADRQLEAGLYPIVADWDTGPAYAPYPRAIFQLFWIPPGGELQLIPPPAFVPPQS
jgi:hypothetical protein